MDSLRTSISQQNKTMKSKFFLILILCQGQSALAQLTLDFSSYLETVLLNNQELKKAANYNAIGQHQLQAAKGGFDPQMNAQMQQKYVFQQYYTFQNYELKQPIFAAHGLKMGYQYGQGPFVNPEDATSLNGLFYLGIQTNLLQGLIIDKNRAELLKAKQYQLFFNAEQRIIQNEVLYQSANEYVDLLLQRSLLTVYQRFESNAKARYNAMVQLVQIGERPTIDSVESFIQLKSRNIDLMTTQLDFNKQLFEVMSKMQMPQLFAYKVDVTNQLDSLYLSSVNFVSKLNQPIATHPIIQQAQAKQGVLGVDLRLKKEMIKPVLEINYQFIQSKGIQNPIWFDLNQYKLSARLSFPLYFRKSLNEYQLSKYWLQNNQFDINTKQIQLSAKASYIQSNYVGLLEQISEAKSLKQLNDQLFEAEQVKFEHGESSLFLLNTREIRALEAEIKLMNLKLKAIKWALEYKYLNASILD